MTGLVFATEQEALPFLKRYERGRFSGLHEGDIQQDESFLVSIIGIGKIKATLRTERLLQRHRLDRIVHPGTCTALSEELEVGSLVAADQVFEGDRIELSAPTYPRMPLEVPYDDLPTATLVTQDHTPRDASARSYWQRIASISDMTGYAVAFVAATYGVPCHIVKVVAGHFGAEDDALRKTRRDAYETIADFLLAAVAP